MVPETPELDTLMVSVEVPEPPVTGLVPNATETPEGVVAVRPTLSEKPVMGVMVMTDEPEPPGGSVSEDGAAAMVKSGRETITVAVASWLIGLVRPTACTVTE